MLYLRDVTLKVNSLAYLLNDQNKNVKHPYKITKLRTKKDKHTFIKNKLVVFN